MTTTASEIVGRFSGEQAYIRRFVSFLEDRVTVNDADVRELTNTLRDEGIESLPVRQQPHHWNQPYSFQDLVKLMEAVRELNFRFQGALLEAESQLTLLAPPPGLERIDSREPIGECIDFFMEGLRHDSSDEEWEAGRNEVLRHQNEIRREYGNEAKILTETDVAYAESSARFLRFSIRGFGYLPIESVLSAFEDTTLVIHLEVDSVAQRLIQQQVARIEDRSHPFITPVMPAMDREYLLRNRNATALDLIQFRYGRFVDRVKCILIDDRQSYNGLEELAHFFPEELERIEVLERGKMLRIYTRDYIRDRLGQEGKLPMPTFVEYVDPPLYR